MKSKTKQIIKFFKALMILALGGLFVYILIVTNAKQNDIICTNIVVEIEDEELIKFINKKDVLKTLTNNQTESIINKKVEEIDIVSLEKKLEKNDYIDNDEVYFNFEGSLKIDIVQKKPLYRIINNKNVSYYISEKDYRVPVSTKFTPKLIIATGYIPNVEDISSNKVNSNLKKLIDFIQADSFWDAMISQIDVKKNGDFLLIPKIKGHTVMLGNIEDIEYKFNKLKTFYKEALPNTDWKKYKQINLKYKGQIICSK